MDRYARQARFPPLSPVGQAALARGRVLLVGCGALGSVSAEMLARAGVGFLRLVDRDVVELSNLHRLALFDEADVEQGLPKAVAAARHLAALRSDLVAEPLVLDVDGLNVAALVADVDVILDGTDNFEARHLINEAALATGKPWIHGACLGATAVAWPIVPGSGACFACLLPESPGPGEVETCETAGVIGPAVHLAASVQVTEAIKLLAGRRDALLDGPWTLDVWTGSSGRVRAVQNPECATCVRGERRFLNRARAGDAISCGRNAVHIAATSGVSPPDLERLVARLHPHRAVTRNPFLVRFSADEGEITVFRDGRILVSGTRDVGRARALVALHLGA